jgi:GNAT superfamily N-acetyltransferase
MQLVEAIRFRKDFAMRFEMRPYQSHDAERLQEIRKIAFTAIHDGFREQLGDDILERVRGDQDRMQAAYLDTLMAGGDRQELYVLLHGEIVAGFIGLTIDEDGIGGEIDLNAVDPTYQGQGGGRLMSEFALVRLKALGVQLARVGTGLDGNHAAARKVYEAAGFDRSLSWTVLYKLI